MLRSSDAPISSAQPAGLGLLVLSPVRESMIVVVPADGSYAAQRLPSAYSGVTDLPRM